MVKEGVCSGVIYLQGGADCRCQGMILRQVGQHGVELDIVGLDMNFAGGRTQDRRDPRSGGHIQNGDGDGGLAINYGMLAKQDDLSGGFTEDNRHLHSRMEDIEQQDHRQPPKRHCQLERVIG